MPIAVVDLDLADLPDTIRVGARYDRALVLVRLEGVPVGQALLPAIGGRVLAPNLHTALVQACGYGYWQERLAQAIGLPRGGLPEGKPPSATVAVCTRERPDDLRLCLMALQKLEGTGHDILVIDNAPRTEATRRVVESFPGVRYVREDRPGLDIARNRALAEATGEIVAFTDDDARPDPGWLAALLRNFRDPLVYASTGLTMPSELEAPAQIWFERESPFGRGFQRRVFSTANHHPLQGGPMGAGVNMAVRREVLARLGGFDEALDVGTPTRSGGDHEMFSRVLAAGYRVVYDPAALVWHRHRREWNALRHTLRGYGTGVYAAWTRAFFRDRELTAPLMAWRWFRHDQLRHLLRSIARRPNRRSLRLVLSELVGCALGPWSYLRSWQRTRRATR